MQEAETGRTEVCETSSQQKKGEQGGTSLSSQQQQEVYDRRIAVQANLGKSKQDPTSKIN
jgi:hypothetical protein